MSEEAETRPRDGSVASRTRQRSCARSSGTGSQAADLMLAARMARHQRPRRLRLRHGRRRADAPLPRPAVAALPAPLGRMVMLNHLSERLRLPDGASSELGGEERAGGALEWPGGASTCASSGSRSACRSGATSSTASTIEKRVLMPHRQNTVHVTLPAPGGRRPGPARAAPVGPLPPARSAVSARSIAEPYTLTAMRTTGIRAVRRRRSAAAAAAAATAQRAAFTLDGGQLDGRPLPRRGRARLRATRASCGAPATSASTSAARRPATLVASTEPWDTIVALVPPEARARPSTSGASACSPRSPRRPATGVGGGAGARRRSVHHHAGRPRRRTRRARARRATRCAR